MGAKTYKELIVWQKSMALAREIYRASALLPKEERYGLQSQMRRSAVSVPSNIAEGNARRTRGEYLQFLGQARGSLAELETQILLCLDLGLLAEAKATLDPVEETGKLLNALMSSLVPNP
jgi:four helix bundle protein